MQMFGDSFSSAEKDSLEIVELSVILHFNDQYISSRIFHLEINTIELVPNRLFVALALQNFQNADVFFEQLAEKALPSSISKLALLRSSFFMAQSKLISFLFGIAVLSKRGLRNIYIADRSSSASW